MFQKLSPPNYTQIPNTIIDEWLPRLSPYLGIILIFIARKTFGWHKPYDKISLTQLEKGTGLSRHTVIKYIEEGLEKGVLVRTPVPNSNEYYYSLPIQAEESTPSEPDPGEITPASSECDEIPSAQDELGGGSARRALGGSARRAPTKETTQNKSSSYTSSNSYHSEDDISYSEEEDRKWEEVLRNWKGRAIQDPQALKRKFVIGWREGGDKEKRKEEDLEKRVERHRKAAKEWEKYELTLDNVRLIARDNFLEVKMGKGICPVGYAVSDKEWETETGWLVEHLKRYRKAE